jgi:hypothetical protein
MLHRIESLFLLFCGVGVLHVVMKPGTQIFLERIFPWSFRAFLMSLFCPFRWFIRGIGAVCGECGEFDTAP